MTDPEYIKGQSDNLPKVDSLMVANYFKSSNDYVNAEVRNVKATRAGRENYGDSAIGYIQLRRMGNICSVKGKISPEHKVRSKYYVVELKVDEVEDKIMSTQCNDCAAALGGCKHAIAFLMWLHRRSEEPSPTSIECYWKRSRLSCVGENMKFLKLKDMKLKTNFTQAATSHALPEQFLNAILKMGQELNPSSQVLKHYYGLDDVQMLSMHQLILMFKERNRGGNAIADDFLRFCSDNMSPTTCAVATEVTRKQSKCPLWYDLRYARITASKMYEVAHCQTLHGTLVEQLVGASVLKDTKAMKRGRILENLVLEVAEQKNGLGIKFEKSGLLLCPDHPLFGASPDAVTENFVVEVKCPSTDKALKSYITSDGNITLKHLAQIQLQMHLAKKKRGLFCIASPDFEKTNNVNLIWVKYDKKLTEELMSKAMTFWKDAIFPIL